MSVGRTVVCKECDKPFETNVYKIYCTLKCQRKRACTRSDIKNPEKTMLNRARHRAKNKQLLFDIDASDIFIPEVCPVLGLPLRLNKGGRSGYFPDSPALDRIKPELGYVKGNVRVISSLANRIKSDLDTKTLRLVLEDLERIENGNNRY